MCTIRGSLSNAPVSVRELLPANATLENCDAESFDGIARMLRDRRPQIVVNCVGVILQRPSATDHGRTISVNALFPHRLTEVLAEWQGRLVHFSTDCVFDGERGSYSESDRANARTLYGQTKFLGEVATTNALTLRTSIIGRELMHRASLLEWLLSQRGKTIRGFQRVMYSGVTTNYLADLVATILAEHPELAGLYQVASSPISKHDLLQALARAYSLDVHIEPDTTEVCDRTLRADKFLQATRIRCPNWSALIEQLVSDPTPYNSWH